MHVSTSRAPSEPKQNHGTTDDGIVYLRELGMKPDRKEELLGVAQAHELLPAREKLLVTTPRIAWQLTLASLVSPYAYPVLSFASSGRGPHLLHINGATPFFQEGIEERVLPVLAQQPWAWQEWQMWVLPALAMLLPLLIHRWLLSRTDPVYLVERSAFAGADYRSAPALAVRICARNLRRRVAIYLLRLGLSAALWYLPMLRLFSSRFVENQGCVSYMVRSVPDYLTCATLILAALAFHLPTTRRVLGPLR